MEGVSNLLNVSQLVRTRPGNRDYSYFLVLEGECSPVSGSLMEAGFAKGEQTHPNGGMGSF